jgi:hypothetical protein
MAATRRRPRPVPVARAAKWRRLESQRKVNAHMTSVILPEELWDWAKDTAKDLRWSFGELMRVALEDWLDTHRIDVNGKSPARATPRRGRGRSPRTLEGDDDRQR